LRHEEERTIYMIRPTYLLDDVVRALKKLGFEPSLREEEGFWLLEARGPDRHVLIRLESEERVVPGLEVLGPIPVSRLAVRAEGPEGFISALRYRLEVELLRCLG